MRETQRKSEPKTIRRRISIFVLSVSLLALLLSIAVAFGGMSSTKNQAILSSEQLGNTAAQDSENALIAQAESDLIEQVEAKAALTEEKLLKIESQAEIVAAYLSEIYNDPARFTAQAVDIARKENDGVWTLQYALVEGVSRDAVRAEIDMAGAVCDVAKPICWQNDDTISSLYFASSSGFMLAYDKNSANMYDGLPEGATPEYFDDFDPRERDWYQDAIETGGVVLTETYLDAFGNLLITCAAPVYRGSDAVGALAMDFLIQDINEQVIESDVGENGIAMLMNRDGVVVASPELKISEEGHYETINLLEDEQFATVAQAMLDEGSGFREGTYHGEDVFAAYAPVEAAGWSLCLMLPREEVIAPAIKSHDSIIQQTAIATGSIQATIQRMLLIFAVAFALIMLGVVLSTRVLSKRITEPILRLTADAKIISEGNLDYQVEIKTGDEIESLGDAFNHMTASLREYMHHLAAVTADRERIAAELDVATTIQASMLPCIFPAFPNRKEFNVFADMHPAKEVGGDFYDFFLTDDDHLWVVMADVSGKGVPAALFMVIAKTLIKNHAAYYQSPGQVLDVVNEQLCENNEAGMFVTAFVGVYEVSTGKLTFANAGHNYPLVCHAHSSYEWLKSKPNFVLAGLEGIHYTDNTIELHAGDRLFLYTDGVTEALDQAQELYGDDRLIQTIGRPETAQMSIEDLTSYIKQDIETFADGAEQADDITMLTLEIC